MNSSPISKNDFIKALILSLSIIFSIIFYQINDRRTKIVFCDVGQGDAAYIRIKNKVDVLVDAGPDNKTLNCLGKYMPFWDRKIELAFLSHHDKDHYGGFSQVIDRYKIDRFLTIDYRFDNKTFQKLKKKIQTKKINYKNIFAEDKIKIFNDEFRIYWPSKDLKSYDSNDYSLVFIFQEKDFRLLFTGDASPFVMNSLSSQSITKVNILKIPHHGSKNGLTEKFLQLADPSVVVISVGKNNSYGHPAKETLELLRAYKVKIKRTDIEGDIIFKIN